MAIMLATIYVVRLWGSNKMIRLSLKFLSSFISIERNWRILDTDRLQSYRMWLICEFFGVVILTLFIVESFLASRSDLEELGYLFSRLLKYCSGWLWYLRASAC